MKLNQNYFYDPDVTRLAKDLLGKELHSRIDGRHTAVIIAETEAYNGITDKASHAYKGRRTKRTEIMYQNGGVSYVYLCYGIHHLFNIVTNIEDIPHAILIRAGIPIRGQDIMMERRGLPSIDPRITRGPGSLSKALGIDIGQNGCSLTSDLIWLEEGKAINKNEILSDKRVGVDYAEEDALLHYRFYIKDCPFVSSPKKQ